MAIAFVAAADGGNNGGGTTSLTFAYTCGSGSNRLLIVCVLGDTSVDDLTTVTYNGVAMTLANKLTPGGISNRWQYFYWLVAPATGANNVVITASNTHFLLGGAADYTGVKQTGQPDAGIAASGSGTIVTLTTALTTVNNNSWVILIENGFSGNPPPVASTGATLRTTDAAFGTWGLFDSNAAITPAGSYSMTTERPGAGASTTIGHILASFQPDTGGAQTFFSRYYYDIKQGR